MLPIALIGFMGAGKTYYGQALAKFLHAPFIDLDQYIETEMGHTITQIFEQKGELWFRELELITLKTLLEDNTALPQRAPLILATGGGTPCNPQASELIQATTTSVYLKVSEPELVHRLSDSPPQQANNAATNPNTSSKATRPLIANLSQPEFEKMVSERMTQRTPFYERAQFTIDAEIIADKPRLSLFYPILQQYVLAGWLPATVLQNLP